MGIRRWLSGTLRPDDVETDSITADSATVNGTTTTGSLETGSITDTDDGQAWETLRELGYEKGDVVILSAFTPPQQRQVTVTGSNYSDAFKAGQVRFKPSDLVRDTSKLRFAQSVRIGTNSSISGTKSIRWFSQTDGEPIGVGVSDTNVQVNKWSGWVNYSIPDPNTTIGVNVQAKQDGGNDCQIDNANLYIGIEL